MMLVCIDTPLLVWGIQGAASTGNEDKVPKTKALFDYFTREHVEVVVPAPVLAEFLVKFQDETHDEVIRIIGRQFRIAPFDAKAASVAASLWRDCIPILEGELDFSPRETLRQVLKVDAQIVATALSCGCKMIYAEDKHIRAIASKVNLPVSPLPGIPEQMTFAFDVSIATTSDSPMADDIVPQE